MALVLHLEDEGVLSQAEVLGFVIDLTLETWKAQQDKQIDLVIMRDPVYTDPDDVLAAAGAYVAMVRRLAEIRAKLIRRERDDRGGETAA